VAPRNPTEAAIAAIWAELLGVTEVGVHDDFFALGGHSLLGVQVISRVRESLGLGLPLCSFWEATELEAFVERIELIAKNNRVLVQRPIRPRSEIGPLPLSLAQERLWFVEQFQPGTAAYNSFFCARINGEINPDILEQSFAELVSRHEVLRTTIGWDEGRACQFFGKGRRPKLEVFDLRMLSRDDGFAEAIARIETAIDQPFNFNSGPLVRLMLCRLSDQNVLGLVAHHLIGDGWSLDVATRELSDIYQARKVGRPSSLPPLPIQYGDFAMWQRDNALNKNWGQSLSYWHERLRNVGSLGLPTDFPRPPIISTQGDWREIRLSRSLSDKLRKLASVEGATLFMVLLAALKVLMRKLSGQRDITVGTAVANRTEPETFGLIGNFINMLALRTQLDGDLTFREVLARVRTTCLGAFAHQQVPFERVVEELRPERDLSASVLFQVLFVMQPPRVQHVFAGTPVKLLELGSRTTRADLEFHLWDQPEISGRVVFSTDLFKPRTIERLVERIQILLTEIVADPGGLLSRSSYLLSEERQLINIWGNGPESKIPFLPVQELIRKRASLQGEATAVVFGERRLSYQLLNSRAAQLAHFLRKLGVGPDTLVGIYLQRSPKMIIALLGVLKAGGAYLPLDPCDPIERLNLIIKDARAAIVVTEQDLKSRAAMLDKLVICLDDNSDLISSCPDIDPKTEVDPENLAYVIYTSGSTGTPKGVQVPHRALTNLVLWMGRELDLKPNDVQAAVASASFDASVAEIFPPLAAGAAICVVPAEEISDGKRLRELLLASRTTILQGTPTLWRLIFEAGGLDVRIKALFGGEATSSELAETLAMSHNAVWHMYGPTETTVWSTAYRVTSGMPLSLGRPLANTQIYILDVDLQLVPIGVVGEICIGGEGVSRGYLGNSMLTADRFIPDSFSGRAGARLYRTGDQARFRDDGGLQFFGRRDHQLKIRGFRIEPGEIEAALVRHPCVRTAVVTAEESSSSSARLVAYVTPAESRAPSVEDLRSFLGRSLPSYMVPAIFAMVEKMPLTHSGKIDRRALPTLNRERPPLAEHFVAPRKEEEKRLAEIWCDVLQVARVGIDDNFFALGGDSMRALRVAYKARAQGLHFSMQALFLSPTIRELASQPELESDVELSSELSRFALLAADDRILLQARSSAIAPESSIANGEQSGG
jgi:amino acid adenylation domain-containing protein